MLGRSHSALALIGSIVLFGGCSSIADPAIPVDQAASFAKKPGEPGSASERLLYRVRLEPANGSRSHGMIHIEIVGGHITVSTHAAGLPPSVRIPQHIHLNPTCANGGGILLNLDAMLTIPGEGASTGAAYPMSNRGGVVNYYASRSLTDLLAAVNTRMGLNLASTDALLAWLNLEQRNAHLHAAVAPFTPQNCGEVERIN